MSEKIIRQLQVVNEKGLHARAAARLVEVASALVADRFGEDM